MPFPAEPYFLASAYMRRNGTVCLLTLGRDCDFNPLPRDHDYPTHAAFSAALHQHCSNAAIPASVVKMHPSRWIDMKLSPDTPNPNRSTPSLTATIRAIRINFRLD